MLLLFVSTW
uniref:Uncharacterized protein n=1 Tax=Arundo donax TaxID=35708 RepID=A0A0A8YQS6_ARUDO